jgi:hypothetical protein
MLRGPKIPAIWGSLFSVSQCCFILRSTLRLGMLTGVFVVGDVNVVLFGLWQ